MTGIWLSFLKVIMLPTVRTHSPGSRNDSAGIPLIELPAIR